MDIRQVKFFDVIALRDILLYIIVANLYQWSGQIILLLPVCGSLYCILQVELLSEFFNEDMLDMCNI